MHLKTAGIPLQPIASSDRCIDNQGMHLGGSSLRGFVVLRVCIYILDEAYRFLTNKEYSVGRKDTDVLVTKDPSISRNHASLRINHSEKSLVKIGLAITSVVNLCSLQVTFYRPMK